MPSGSATQIALYISATDTTIRNNIIDLTNAAYHIGINISRRSTEPPPNNVKVYNNTIYSASTGNFMAVQIDTTATNTTVINNLGSAPSASGPVMINGTGASGLVQSKNLLNNSPSTLFVNAPPTASADFRLKTGSPALNNGQTNSNLTPVPVFSDYLLTLSPLFYSPINIGAYQGPGL
jgi:hypothetical protein